MSHSNRYTNYQRTKAKNARINAAVIRQAAERPENHAMRSDLMSEAKRYDAIALAAEGRATVARF